MTKTHFFKVHLTYLQKQRKESLLRVLKARNEYSSPDVLGQANMVQTIKETKISPDLEKQIPGQDRFLVDTN